MYKRQSILSDSQIEEYVSKAEAINLDVLIEVHDEEELGRVSKFHNALIGVNNRNLKTFEVDLMNAVRLRKNYDGNQKSAYDYLKDWDFIESTSSNAATVFHVVLDELLKNIYKDELDLVDNKAFDALVHFSMLPHRNIHWVLSEGKSSWIDDVRTKDEVETLEKIVITSFEKGIILSCIDKAWKEHLKSMDELKQSRTTSKSWSLARKRSAWLVSMCACAAFLYIAVRVYEIHIEMLLKNFFMVLLGSLVVISFGFFVGWLMAFFRRPK